MKRDLASPLSKVFMGWPPFRYLKWRCDREQIASNPRRVPHKRWIPNRGCGTEVHTYLVIPHFRCHQNSAEQHTLPIGRMQRKPGILNHPVDVHDRNNAAFGRQGLLCFMVRPYTKHGVMLGRHRIHTLREHMQAVVCACPQKKNKYVYPHTRRALCVYPHTRRSSTYRSVKEPVHKIIYHFIRWNVRSVASWHSCFCQGERSFIKLRREGLWILLLMSVQYCVVEC